MVTAGVISSVASRMASSQAMGRGAGVLATAVSDGDEGTKVSDIPRYRSRADLVARLLHRGREGGVGKWPLVLDADFAGNSIDGNSGHTAEREQLVTDRALAVRTGHTVHQ